LPETPTDDDRTDRTASGYDALSRRADEDLDPEGSPWGDSHFQTHYSWPATREILPGVEGRRVLIAGCGRGDHVEHFLEGGASVVGVDASEEALSTARERFGDRATFERADLSDPLEFEADAFDLAFSHLVFGHLREWRPLFAELARVTAPGGRVAFATIHPRFLRERNGVETYYGVDEIRTEWPGAEIPTHHRPMGAVVRPLIEAGFRIEAFEEPRPQERYADHAPERYGTAQVRPAVLCVRARLEAE
jgi:SAM-dependent methyltransferase